MKTEIWAIGIIVLSGMFGAFGPILLKKGASTFDIRMINEIFRNKHIILGLLIYGLSAIVALPALKGGDLSVIYPLVGLSYVWVCFYSIWFLKEKMNLVKWLGIIMILFGSALVGGGSL